MNPSQSSRPRYEFRVHWRRDGRQRATAIFQTEAAARRKADGILGLDAIKEGTRFDDLPDLISPPIVEAREVGPWEPLPDQQIEPSDGAVARMEEWAVPGSQSGVGTGIF